MKSVCGCLKEVIPSIRLRLEKFCYVGGYAVQPCYFEVPREMEKKFEIAGFQNNQGSLKFITMNHFLIKYSTV